MTEYQTAYWAKPFGMNYLGMNKNFKNLPMTDAVSFYYFEHDVHQAVTLDIEPERYRLIKVWVSP